jgi:hypothetical protein
VARHQPSPVSEDSTVQLINKPLQAQQAGGKREVRVGPGHPSSHRIGALRAGGPLPALSFAPSISSALVVWLFCADISFGRGVLVRICQAAAPVLGPGRCEPFVLNDPKRSCLFPIPQRGAWRSTLPSLSVAAAAAAAPPPAAVQLLARFGNIPRAMPGFITLYRGWYIRPGTGQSLLYPGP